MFLIGPEFAWISYFSFFLLQGVFISFSFYTVEESSFFIEIYHGFVLFKKVHCYFWVLSLDGFYSESDGDLSFFYTQSVYVQNFGIWVVFKDYDFLNLLNIRSEAHRFSSSNHETCSSCPWLNPWWRRGWWSLLAKKWNLLVANDTVVGDCTFVELFTATSTWWFKAVVRAHFELFGEGHLFL